MKHHLTCRSVDSSASNISYPCDMVWDNLFKGLETRLRKLQDRVGIVVLRIAFDVSSENVLEELGWSDRSFAYAGAKLWNSLPTCSSTKSANTL